MRFALAFFVLLTVSLAAQSRATEFGPLYTNGFAPEHPDWRVGYVSEPMTLSTTLFGTGGAPLAGEEVRFFAVHAALPNSPTFTVSAFTDSNGLVTATLPPFADYGPYRFDMSFAGNTGSAPAGFTTYLHVYQRSTILVNDAVGGPGEQINVPISFVTLPNNAPVGMRRIDWTFGGQSHNLLTEANGVGAVPLTLPTVEGFYSLTVSIRPDFFPSHFANEAGQRIPPVVTVNIQVAKRVTSLAPIVATRRVLGNLQAFTVLTDQNGPVANASVDFTQTTPSAVIEIVNAMTDANGYAFASFSGLELGPHTLRAFYAGDAAHAAASTADTLIDVIPEQVASLTISGLQAHTLPSGQAVRMTVTLSPPIAGQVITTTHTLPDGRSGQLSMTTDSSGRAFFDLNLIERGRHTISAHFAGNDVLSAASATFPVSIYVPVGLTLPSSISVAAGAPLQLTVESHNGLLFGHTASFTFSGSGAVPPSQVAQFGGVSASVMVTFPEAGTFTARATFFNPAGFFTNVPPSFPPQPSVATTTITVVHAATQLSDITGPSSGFVDDTLNVSSVLSRVDGIPVGASDVAFTFTAPNGTATVVTVVTDSAGGATATFRPTARGQHSVFARHAGNNTLAQAISQTTTFQVYQRTTLSMAPPLGVRATVPISLRAQLHTLPGSSGVAGERIEFSFEGESAPGSQFAITDATGAATISVTFASAGAFIARASYASSGFFIGESTSTTITVDRMPASIQTTIPATADAQTSVALSARLTDDHGGVSGATLAFTAGATTVTATTDSTGNASASIAAGCDALAVSISFAGDALRHSSAAGPQTVNVLDRVAPLITAPSSLTIGSNAGCTYVGSIGTASASDNCSTGSALTITNDAPAIFPLGLTTVTWKVTDASGNFATAIQLVTIEDDDRPSITAPAPLALTTNAGADACGIAISDAMLGSATASDECSAVTVLRSGVPAGGFFPVGTTTIVYTATDQAGNSSDATQTVTVLDATAPVVTVSLIPTGKPKKSSGVFHVSLIATDNCAVITTTGMMPIPAGAQGFSIRTSNGNQSSITIDFAKKQITLAGKDQAALTSLLNQLLATGGVTVAQGQMIAIEQDAKKPVELRFDGGALVSLTAPNPVLQGTATDSSGNMGMATATPHFP